jgi:hypothetical protein
VTGLALIIRYHEPITRESAREEAHRELSKDAYRAAEPSVAERALTWLLDRIAELFDRATGSSPGGGLGLLAIVAVVVLLVVAVLVRFGPLSGSATRAPEFDPGPLGSVPADHRALADRFAAEGRYADAVRERLRAVVRHLEGRGAVDPRPGRTVEEIVTEAGRALPGAAAELAAGARLFSEIWYGGRAAVAADDERLREVDRRVAAADDGDGTVEVARPDWAVPGGEVR